jgi:hypothetical protein
MHSCSTAWAPQPRPVARVCVLKFPHEAVLIATGHVGLARAESATYVDLTPMLAATMSRAERLTQYLTLVRPTLGREDLLRHGEKLVRSLRPLRGGHRQGDRLPHLRHAPPPPAAQGALLRALRRQDSCSHRFGPYRLPGRTESAKWTPPGRALPRKWPWHAECRGPPPCPAPMTCCPAAPLPSPPRPPLSGTSLSPRTDGLPPVGPAAVPGQAQEPTALQGHPRGDMPDPESSTGGIEDKEAAWHSRFANSSSGSTR